MSQVTFRRALNLFPIHCQAEIDLAVLQLRTIRRERRAKGLSQAFPRALALLSYAMNTAWLDGWSNEDRRAWGKLAGLRPAKLRTRALRVATRAVKAQKDYVDQTGDRKYSYDVLWAHAFALLCQRQEGGKLAAQAFAAALEANRKHGAAPDFYLMADAADACVSLGILAAGDSPHVDDAVNARQLIEDAIAGQAGTDGKHDVPEWFYWVRAWVTFAESVTAPGVPNFKRDKLNESLADLALAVPEDGDAPADTDVGALRAVASLELAKLAAADKRNEQIEAAKDLWDDFVATLRLERGLRWNSREEKRRGLFPRKATNKAAMIEQTWTAALEQLDKDEDGDGDEAAD